MDILGRLQRTGFKDHFKRMPGTGSLYFLDFIAASLIIAREERAYAEHHVYLRCTIVHGQCRFGSLDFNKGLRGGEAAAHAGNFRGFHFQRIGNYFSEIGINANRGKSRQFGVRVSKIVYLFNQSQHAFLRIRNRQRGQFYGSKELAQRFRRVVFSLALFKEFCNGGVCLFVGHRRVKLGKSLFVFVQFVVRFFVVATAMAMFAHLV